MTLTSDIIRCSYCDKSIEYRRSRISSSTGYLVCQDCRTTPSVAEAPTDSTHYQEIFAEFKSAKLLDSPHKSDYLHSPSEETLYERNLQEFDLLDNPISQIERTLQSAGLMVPVGLPSRKDVDSLASAPFFQAASSSHHRYASQHQSDPPGSISLDQALAEFDLSEYRNTSDGINLLKPKRSEMKGKSCLCVVCHRHFESFLTLNEHKLIHIPAALPQCNERADQAISIKGQPSIKTKIVASNKTPRSRGVLILRGGRSIRVPKNHPANKFPCHYEWCDITFPTIGQLWDHIDNTIHDISFMKVKYVCKNCNQSYAHRRSLVNHQRLHTGINLYSCEVCNKQFTKHSELIRHISIHAGEKAHKFGIYAKNLLCLVL